MSLNNSVKLRENRFSHELGGFLFYCHFFFFFTMRVAVCVCVCALCGCFVCEFVCVRRRRSGIICESQNSLGDCSADWRAHCGGSDSDSPDSVCSAAEFFFDSISVDRGGGAPTETSMTRCLKYRYIDCDYRYFHVTNGAGAGSHYNWRQKLKIIT